MTVLLEYFNQVIVLLKSIDLRTVFLKANLLCIIIIIIYQLYITYYIVYCTLVL